MLIELQIIKSLINGLYIFIRDIFVLPFKILNKIIYANKISRISSLDSINRKSELEDIPEIKFKEISLENPEIFTKFAETFDKETLLHKNNKATIEDKAKSAFTSSTIITAIGSIIATNVITNGIVIKIFLTISIVSLIICMILSISNFIQFNIFANLLQCERSDKGDIINKNGFIDEIQVMTLYEVFNREMNTVRALINRLSFIWFTIGIISLSITLLIYIWMNNTSNHVKDEFKINSSTQTSNQVPQKMLTQPIPSDKQEKMQLNNIYIQLQAPVSFVKLKGQELHHHVQKPLSSPIIYDTIYLLKSDTTLQCIKK